MRADAIEDFIRRNWGGIEESYRVGQRNFTWYDKDKMLLHNGLPFAVWLIDTSTRDGSELAKAVARASWRSEEIGSNQIEEWKGEHRRAGTEPVMSVPMPIERSVMVAQCFDKATARSLAREPSPSEFWVVVVVRGCFCSVAVEKPLVVY